jgi:hypothetical protein
MHIGIIQNLLKTIQDLYKVYMRKSAPSSFYIDSNRSRMVEVGELCANPFKNHTGELIIVHFLLINSNKTRVLRSTNERQPALARSPAVHAFLAVGGACVSQ